VQAQQRTPDVPGAPDGQLAHCSTLPPRTGSQGLAAQTLAAAAAQPPLSAVPWPADTERSDPRKNKSIGGFTLNPWPLVGFLFDALTLKLQLLLIEWLTIRLHLQLYS